jgi:2-dehydro-3-deoxyphosphooctonate aldolase (KDO 8-P synthase)
MKLSSFEVGPERPFFLIAGPCVIESDALVQDVAGRLKEMTGKLGIPFSSNVVRQGQPLVALELSRTGAMRPQDLGAGAEQFKVPVLTDVLKTRRSPKLPRWSMCCRHPRFSAGRPTSSRRSPARANR